MIDPISIGLGVGAAWLYSHFTKDDSPEYSKNEMTMMVISSFLYSVAEADGHVDDREEKLIRNIFRETVESGGETLDDDRLDLCLRESRNNEELQNAVVGYSQKDADFRGYLLTRGWQVSAKDGKITDDEIEFMVRAGAVMGATEDEIMLSMLPYCRQPTNSENLDEAREVLGVHTDASTQEIKKKYRSLSNKYHPDKFQSEDDVVVEMATEKFRQLTEAYELLLGQNEQHEYILKSSRSTIAVATSRGICRCYFCDQKAKLPLLKNVETARCAKCQALLAFDKDTGQWLFENAVNADA